MKENIELFTAKLSATLNLLWGITDSSVILQIAKDYMEYKHSIDLKLEQYLENKLTITLPETWIQALQSHNIFYSYCYGLFKTIPVTILAQGYRVAVLMSDSLKSRQSDYFQQLIDQCLRLNG